MNDPPLRKIIHVDMDAFFASVEQRDDPTLRGRPLAVGYAAARGVVAAASYEARAFGVRSAMPSTTAMRKCPELVFVPPRFEVYKAVSRQIHAIFAEYTGLIEPLSLDEAYLDVSANLRGLPTASQTAEEIRGRIFAETGLTASAGVSYNKFLAKLASDQRKPNGQYVVPPGRGEIYVESLPIGRFHGVGPVTAAKMERLGIFTGADLRRQSLEFLEQHFGKSGPWYHAISRGVDERPVNPDRERKSSGAETTFQRDLLDPREIEAGVLSMADDVWDWCAKTGARARTVTVKVKWADFKQVTRSRSVSTLVGDPEMLRAVSLSLVRTLFPPRTGVRLVGVTLSNFGQAQRSGADRLDFAAPILAPPPVEQPTGGQA